MSRNQALWSKYLMDGQLLYGMRCRWPEWLSVLSHWRRAYLSRLYQSLKESPCPIRTKSGSPNLKWRYSLVSICHTKRSPCLLRVLVRLYLAPQTLISIGWISWSINAAANSRIWEATGPIEQVVRGYQYFSLRVVYTQQKIAGISQGRLRSTGSIVEVNANSYLGQKSYLYDF